MGACALKRGEPLKRRKSLERRSELKADVEKVREFLRRSHELERAALSRAAGMRRSSRGEGPLTPAQWREAVHDASDGRCVMTGARSRDADDPRFHPHHCLAKRELRARGLLGVVWDPRNGIWLAKRAHERHEVAFERVPAEKLPAAVWAFCAELDAAAGTEWATCLVLRAHPPAGFSRGSHEEDSGGEG